MHKILIFSATLAACTTPLNNGSSTGGSSGSADSGGASAGGYTYTNATADADHSAPACTAQTQTDLTTLAMPCAATAAGASCTNDYDCSSGQTCQSSQCTAASVEDKDFGTLTLADAGDYAISVFIPADDPTDAPPDPDMLAFTFTSAARDITLLQTVGSPLRASWQSAALLSARVATEPAFRHGEQAALLRGAKPVMPSSLARDTCAADQYGYNGACNAIGATFQLNCLFCGSGGKEITVAVLAIEGDTAILGDTSDNLQSSDYQTVLDNFSKIAGPRDRIFFNQNQSHATNLDTDGNGMVGIVMSSAVGSDAGVAGLYDYRDTLAKSDSSASGNVSDIVWVEPPGKQITIKLSNTNVTANNDTASATLAHEYQHLINFARRAKITPAAPETLFLNESLSHLAEDITGFGNTNIDSVALYLSSPESVGLWQSDNGPDADSSELRGYGYLYMRYLIETWGGYDWDGSGNIVDKGMLPYLDRFYTNSTTGLNSLAQTAGSSFDTFFAFIPRVGISNNPAFTAAPARFQYQATRPDPLTQQTTGINLWDTQRKDAYGNANIGGYVPKTCVDDQSNNNCSVFATGGATLTWANVTAGSTVSLKAPSAFNLRWAAVKVK